jgi:histidyl-tRNA synthetase
VPADQPIVAKLPKIADHLDAECRAHFDELQRQLALREIPYTIEPRLVRGLDYYMRTTFEITSPVLGAQNALVGGGRYDGLAELLGGPPTKGIGFALGTDRFIEAIQAAGKVKVAPRMDVFIAWLGGATSAQVYPVAVRLAGKLRAAGANVELPPEEMKLKKAMALADKLGARYALLIGENEIAAGKFTLRRMSDGAQEALGEGELLRKLEAAASPD